MNCGEGGDDDRTFRANFSTEGVAKLRDRVTEKLKEFMGDYTDDTLVEYVIVLLKNGRRKEEAKNELDVFLGDDSESFVSWLWDHLGSNLNMYTVSHGVPPDGVSKVKPVDQKQAGKDDSQHLGSESEKEKHLKSSRSGRSRDWRGLVGDDKQHTLKSSIADGNYAREESHRPRRSFSPRSEVHRKRSRPEEREHNKREIVSQTTIDVPRRLLQFAVRDAVAPSRPSSFGTERSLKRLRSVVSTASEQSSLEERPKRIQSVAKASTEEHPQSIRSVVNVSNAMATAIRAVAEAAKDVKKVKPSRNVFDRLGRAADLSDTSDQLVEFQEGYDVNAPERTYGDLREGVIIHNESDHRRHYVSDTNLSQKASKMAYDCGREYEAYDGMDVGSRGIMDVSDSGASVANKNEDTLMFPHNAAKVIDGRAQKVWKDQVQPVSIPDISHRPVNISVAMDTSKALQYVEVKEAGRVDFQNSVAESKTVTPKLPSMQLMEEKNRAAGLGNGNIKSETISVKDSQKMQTSTPGLYSTGLPTDDADSRTIFVNNVHFAATKDSLSRHFNKFGEVLKVVILTDAATGLPKGSAYVEFMRKEAADLALSLDGTSFMSRILKVVKKSSAPPEAASTLSWPRTARAFPYPVPGYGRMPFSRGVPNVYRARPTMKPGAKSMQWRRDAQLNASQATNPASNNTPSAAPRGLTYVRTEHKTNGSSTNA